MIVGHTAVRSALEAHLPPVFALRGPASVGKRTLVEHVAEYHGIGPTQRLMIENMTPLQARAVARQMSASPLVDKVLVHLRADGITPEALTSLLAVLEAPPPGMYVALTASRPLPPTVASRAMAYRTGLLSADEVFQVLTGALSVPAAVARRAARMARGQVRRALTAGFLSDSRVRVLNVVAAVASRDEQALEDATAAWSADDHQLLFVWLAEALSRRWSVFDARESGALLADPLLLRRMLLALRTEGTARLSIRASLGALL